MNTSNPSSRRHGWNDALVYLAQAPPEGTAPAARERLLSMLNCS
ncbi:hypothetical protein AGATL06_30360 [Agathobaculum sp. TL06]